MKKQLRGIQLTLAAILDPWPWLPGGDVGRARYLPLALISSAAGLVPVFRDRRE